ncbi:SDR family oxidoreductase [Paenibacillus lemnae]|uniref:SDR family oxidoreductase n=1 Tax=Paenibacillus lemnae TaxID=1330551 RepID=A0A848M588_PAELE|nr:SDR family NAD(P)-dependent oxidoreductase [Paenibacillus lemnae]NMO96278.1 SDR family oxidoreductase [Paenibacillus lemnae]
MTQGQSRFHGKTAVVTGAGSGIGRAAAVKLAKEGANVALFDLMDDRSEEVVKELNDIRDGCAHAFDVDTTDAKRVEKAVQETAEIFGGIDIVFANAGINGVLSPVDEMNLEDWQKTLDVNLNGTFLTVKHTVPYLKKNGKGSIIITSSVNGTRVFTGFGMIAYSTTKAGQVAFAKMAALELAKFKIRVNVVCPGAISTNIDQSTKKQGNLEEITIPIEYPDGGQPLEHGPGEPEDVADLVAFLASDESRHITGAQIFIDGAESLLR